MQATSPCCVRMILARLCALQGSVFHFAIVCLRFSTWIPQTPSITAMLACFGVSSFLQQHESIECAFCVADLGSPWQAYHDCLVEAPAWLFFRRHQQHLQVIDLPNMFHCSNLCILLFFKIEIQASEWDFADIFPRLCCTRYVASVYTRYLNYCNLLSRTWQT